MRVTERACIETNISRWARTPIGMCFVMNTNFRIPPKLNALHCVSLCVRVYFLEQRRPHKNAQAMVEFVLHHIEHSVKNSDKRVKDGDWVGKKTTFNAFIDGRLSQCDFHLEFLKNFASNCARKCRNYGLFIQSQPLCVSRTSTNTDCHLTTLIVIWIHDFVIFLTPFSTHFVTIVLKMTRANLRTWGGEGNFKKVVMQNA